MTKLHTLLISACLMLAGCDTISDIATEAAEDWFFNDEEDCGCNQNLIHGISQDDMPESGEVVMRVSRSKGSVDITIYRGNMEKGDVVETISADKERITTELRPNVTYTFVARYVIDSDTIMVPVNSRYVCEMNECNGLQCYFFKNNVVDLSLKY